jgi:hypothetical protein
MGWITVEVDGELSLEKNYISKDHSEYYVAKEGQPPKMWPYLGSDGQKALEAFRSLAG